MKLLIIGSKGFIGQHCMNYFSNSSNEIYGCDVVTDYAATNYFLIDATNTDFKSIFEKHQFDVCLNCSGAAEVSTSILNPLRDYMLNTLNVFKLLDAIRIYQPLCKYINISSAAVYGNPQYLPIDEKHPLNPISPYGFHKLMAENICTEFYNMYNIKTVNLRIFSAYGEGLKKQLFWDLYQKSKKSNNIELSGSGTESRDFIYIGDILQAIDLIIKNDNFENSIYNVANGIEINISEATETFFFAIEKGIEFSFDKNNKSGYPINWVANISKLKSIGYQNQFTLLEGLTRYAEWLKE